LFLEARQEVQNVLTLLEILNLNKVVAVLSVTRVLKLDLRETILDKLTIIYISEASPLAL